MAPQDPNYQISYRRVCFASFPTLPFIRYVHFVKDLNGNT